MYNYRKLQFFIRLIRSYNIDHLALFKLGYPTYASENQRFLGCGYSTLRICLEVLRKTIEKRFVTEFRIIGIHYFLKKYNTFMCNQSLKYQKKLTNGSLVRFHPNQIVIELLLIWNDDASTIFFRWTRYELVLGRERNPC